MPVFPLLELITGMNTQSTIEAFAIKSGFNEFEIKAQNYSTRIRRATDDD